METEEENKKSKEEDNLLRYAPKYEENPFIESAVREIQSNLVVKQRFGNRIDQKGISSVVDQNTGEIFKTSFLRRVEVDEDIFAKVYSNQIALFHNLTTPGIRVLTYFMSTLKPNSVRAELDKKKCMEFCKYKTKKPIYKGLAELVNAGIIARSWNDSIYFINPLVFFNGNRIVFAVEYIKTKHPEVKHKTLEKSLEQIQNQELRNMRNQKLEELKDFTENLPQYPTMDEALFPDGVNPIE